MDPRSLIKPELIAPCGMNCAVCMGRLLRIENKCPGCRGENTNKPRHCIRCIIINCDNLRENNLIFCSDKCSKFPCARLKALDKRYRTKYHMSMLENLKNISEFGINSFIKSEITRWTCATCGGIICVHRGFCIDCGDKLPNTTANII